MEAPHLVFVGELDTTTTTTAVSYPPLPAPIQSTTTEQANEVCVSERNVNADFVYFGCGLRLLQLVPDRPEKPTPLDTCVREAGRRTLHLGC